MLSLWYEIHDLFVLKTGMASYQLNVDALTYIFDLFKIEEKVDKIMLTRDLRSIATGFIMESSDMEIKQFNKKQNKK